MAEHADATKLDIVEPSAGVALADADAEPATTEAATESMEADSIDIDADADQPRSASSDPATQGRGNHWSPARYAGTFGLVALVAVCALGGWLGWQSWHAQRTQTQRAAFIQAGRQAALNLTTINDADVEADVQRILDGATGTFHDDFHNRAQPFIDVVKQAKSKSQGAVTEAGLESVDGNQAQVLVAVSVTTTVGNADQQPPPRAWRMRITVEKTDHALKVSDVQFVP
jgi:Mce-associated membrane protein